MHVPHDRDARGRMLSSSAPRLLVGVVAITLLAITGCTPDRPAKVPESPAAGWPTSLNDFTITWTTEPGINLVTDAAAIAARAYVESYYLATITADEKYLYPGFKDAVEPNQPSPSWPPGTSDLHPDLRYSEPHIWIGTVRHHVLSIIRSGGDATVVACAYMYGSAMELSDGGPYSANVGTYADPSGIFPMRIGLRAPASGQAKSTAQQGTSKGAFR
jgi:hypothetical protein